MNVPPSFEMLLLNVDERGIASLTLNRPKEHNALGQKLISELHRAADWLAATKGIRATVLTGVGKTFCAGGDLDWMRQGRLRTRAQNFYESGALGRMLRALNELPMPLIGRINGPAYGGGIGMIAVCDITIAVDTGVYALTEVNLGLIAANISPFVVARMGEASSRRNFLTGRRMSAAEAVRQGLISEVVTAEELDAAVEKELADVFRCAPGAVADTKKLITYVHSHDLPTSMIYAADRLVDAWETEEGREGIDTFFAKTKPWWRKT